MKINEIVRRKYGDIVPKRYLELLGTLESRERMLKEARENKGVCPLHYSNVNDIKAELYDMLMSDGIIVIAHIANKTIEEEKRNEY